MTARSAIEAACRRPEGTVGRLIDAFVTALVIARIYESDHPRLAKSIGNLQLHLAEYREQFGDDTFIVSVTRDFVIFRRRPLFGASQTAARILKMLATWHSGGIEIKVDAPQDEVATFLKTAFERPGPDEDWEHVNARLKQRRVRSLKLLPPYRERIGASREGLFQVPMRLYQSVIELLQDTSIRVCQGSTIDLASIQGHVEDVLLRLEGAEGPMLNLAREDHYDAFTFGHSVRVSVLSLNFARRLTDDAQLLNRIGSAALLHDVGKALIPFEVLHSTKPLSEEERLIMSTHPALGAELLLDHYESDPLAVAVAFGHHCSCADHGPPVDAAAADGHPQHSYPRTLHRQRPSLVTELVKICDVYEALTAARPYRRPMTPTRAYRVMMSMQGHFHRALLRRFVETNGIWPVGQLVRLNTGELARVVAQREHLDRPLVDLVRDADGEMFDEAADTFVDLSAPSGDAARTVVATAPDDLLRTP